MLLYTRVDREFRRRSGGISMGSASDAGGAPHNVPNGEEAVVRPLSSQQKAPHAALIKCADCGLHEAAADLTNRRHGVGDGEASFWVDRDGRYAE